ncbi:hypothetical protein C8R46DRAFT_1178255 [Mycena filopes]|nr:hypothetical protein C8R46DRAFT_1178255 [Mycena filopes]
MSTHPYNRRKDRELVCVAQAQYRLDLVAKWPITSGMRVLELGCGQGDTTLALAEAVGVNGHVDAVDPGPPDYVRIPDAPRYDIAVLANSLWYFASPALILETLRVLATRARHCPEGSNATTHLLAVLAQGAMECRKPASQSNVRTIVSPARIKDLATQAGLVLQTEGLVTPGAEVYDGRWETQHAVRAQFTDEVEEFVKDDREKGMILAMKDAVEASLTRVGGMKSVGTMDGWVGVFKANE